MTASSMADSRKFA